MSASRRPRRIAADEAHAWARNLRLGNPYAKLVLSMLTIYVNGDGSCFVGIGQLADDCELAENTVRRRLSFLEDIGAIAKFPQWRDEHGRLNGDGRGRRTTDDIRLLINGDAEEIEARANRKPDPDRDSGPDDDDNGPINPAPGEPLSPAPGEGLNPVSPALGVQQPSHCGEGLISEPEPEKNPPNPPSGGGRGTSLDQESEERLLRFIAAYPQAVTDYPKARALWGAMTAQEQDDAITGAKGYAAFLADLGRKGRSRNVKDAHRWLRDRLWIGYLASGKKTEAVAKMRSVPADSREGRAWLALHRIAKMPRPYESAGGLTLPQELSPAQLALADAPVIYDWLFIAEESKQQCGAWNEFIGRALEGKARGLLISNDNPGPWKIRAPRDVRGFFAPWPWPPKADGTVYSGSDPPQPERVDGTLATQDDLEEMAKG